MAVPVIEIEAAFGDQPGASSYTWQTIHEDGVTPVVRGFTYKRGRQTMLNRMEAGTGGATLRDDTSDFDRDNPDSIWYPNVRPMVPIRGRATIDAITYPLYQHFVERWPRTLRVKDVYAERMITTVDGFEWLARAGLSGQTYPQELAGVRIAAVLDDVGWSSALRDLDAGVDEVAATTYEADDEAKALIHLLDVAESEQGMLFVDAQGRVAYVQRHALIAAPYTTSQVTFHDGVAGGDFPYFDSVPSFDLDVTFNKFSGTREGGDTRTAADAVSEDDNGLRSSQFTSLVTTDALVQSQAEWRLAQFKDPLDRIESITVKPGNDTDFWKAVLALEIGERITVAEKPPGFALAKSADYVIQNIAADFPPGPRVDARFTFGLWPAESATWLILDNATAGKLDTGKLAY